MASQRAQELAKRFEGANDAFIAYIETLTPEQWLTVCTDEQRSVAALSHHVAWGYLVEIEAFRAFAQAEAYKARTIAELDTHNAQEADEYAEGDRSEIIALLRENAAYTVGIVRNLTDEQLAKTGVYIDGRRELSVDLWIERVLLGHIQAHLASISEALS